MNPARIGGKLVAAASAILLMSAAASAQDDDNGPMTQGEDAKYVSVSYVDFKPGHRERAIEIINEYFVPAADNAGVSHPMVGLHMQTGDWDMIVVWEMEGGMADMEWYRSPEDIKWYESFVELVGGQEEADKIMKEYQDALASTQVEVGHYHTGETDE